jgi:effector-binding domain-containing protein
MFFVCQNSLLSSLVDCDTTRIRTNLFKMVLGDQQTAVAVYKDFEQFLQRVCKSLENKELNEIFDVGGGDYSSVIASKKQGTFVFIFIILLGDCLIA